MAVPNLKSGTLIVEPGRATVILTSTTYTDIIGTVATGYAFFLEQISISNKGAATAGVTIALNDGTTDFEIASGRTIQIKSVLNAAQGRSLILIEGDKLHAKLAATGEVHFVVPYTKAH